MPIQYSLIRVNAYSCDLLEVFNYQDQDDHTLYGNVHAILSAGEAHTGSSYHIEQTEIMIWYQNNTRNKLQVFMLDDGRCVPLVPNHRANAMTEAG